MVTLSNQKVLSTGGSLFSSFEKLGMRTSDFAVVSLPPCGEGSRVGGEGPGRTRWAQGSPTPHPIPLRKGEGGQIIGIADC